MQQKSILNLVLLLLLAFFSYLLLNITLKYLPISDTAAFLQLKQQYISIKHWKIAFFTHVFTSMFVLMAGFTQFSKYFLKNYRIAHRFLGYIYVFDILIITGPASFVMALYANGGFSSRAAFTILAISWWFTTFKALQTARNKDFNAHKNWMYRSYALTLSALTLRAWKYAIIKIAVMHGIELPPMDVYRTVAWLGFVPNWLLAEWLIFTNKTDAALR